MQSSGPHFLLYTAVSVRTDRPSRWRFELRPTGPIGEGERIAAADVEADADASRLELLAVVRGFEALDQPSEVTLLSVSRHLRRAIRHDMAQWREQGWRWERFGRLVPIRDQDLWERIDRAMAIHQVECWPWPARGTGAGRVIDQFEENRPNGRRNVVLGHGYFTDGRALSRTA